MINEINDQLNVQPDKKDVALHLKLSRSIKVAFLPYFLDGFFREIAPPSEWPWNRRKPARSDPQWPVGAGRVVSRWIKVVFYCIFLTLTTWRERVDFRGADFSGKWHRRLNGLEIGENLPDPILYGLLVPAGWSPGGLKLLFTVFSWRWRLDVNVLTFVAHIFPGNGTAIWMALKSAKTRRIRSSMACWYRPRGRGPGCGARAGDQRPGPAMEQLQFVPQNLGQIRKFSLWRWPCQRRTRRPKTTTMELRPAIFQFTLPLKSSMIWLDGVEQAD